MQLVRAGVLLAGLAAGAFVIAQGLPASVPPDPTGTGPVDATSAPMPMALVTGLLMIIGAGTVLPYPRAAAAVFLGAAVLGLGVGILAPEPDHLAYGLIAAVLAVFAIVGARRTRQPGPASGGPASA